MVVRGPCPGTTMVSSGSVKSWERFVRRACYHETMPPPMDPAIREELEAFVARRKSEMPDAFI